MSDPVPHHRHQSSLEGVIDALASSPQLSSEQRDQQIRVFNAIIKACEPLQHTRGLYKPITLVRLTYEYACSDESRNSFLHFFYQQTRISAESSESDLSSCDYGPELTTFADTLIQYFFLPLKASTRKTPQPSPANLSESQSAQSPVGTTGRLAILRGDCFKRDHYRCVISRTFDSYEARQRVIRNGTEKARDDEGKLLKDERVPFAALEVAHIIPHSLISLGTGKLELDESKKIALRILDMFDPCVVHLIDGVDIDCPSNAISLTHDFHQLFGNFEAYFEPIGDKPHTYRVESVITDFIRHPIFPVNRTLFLTDTRTIDPPSQRLLAVHNAIAHILHLSAAGYHIDKILKDLDEREVMADGSTPIGYFASLRLGGWLDGQIRAY